MNAKTILVAPFNIVSSLPPELEGSTKIVQAALVEHLEAHGKTVRIIGFRIGRDLWSASMKEVRDSGQPKNFDNAARVYARKLGEIVEFDALIIPSIFVQNAKARSRTVRWDGAEQQIERRGRSPHGLYRQGTLSVRAVSAFVYVLDRNGNKIHTKRAGLELIQHIEFRAEKEAGYSSKKENTWHLVDDSPPIEDKDRVRAGMAAALFPFLPVEVPAINVPGPPE